jgi:hypothetical protein
MITLFREEASRLSIHDGPGGTGLAVDFASGSLSGQLRIEIWPAVSVDDRLLAVLSETIPTCAFTGKLEWAPSMRLLRIW